jgi:AcrR family transcriptional regulator
MKKDTRTKILDAGVQCWPDISVSAIANAAGITHPAIFYYFTKDSLKLAIAKHAVETGNSRVIVQLIASRHPAINKMSAAEKMRHFNAVKSN